MKRWSRVTAMPIDALSRMASRSSRVRSVSVTSRALITRYSRRSITKRAPDTSIEHGAPVSVAKRGRHVLHAAVLAQLRDEAARARPASVQMPSSIEVRPTTSSAL